MCEKTLLDISNLSDHACDVGIEAMYKASTGDGGDDQWQPHESPFIRELIELFTQRGLTQIDAVRKELNEWIAGHRHHPAEEHIPHPGLVRRWSADEVSLVRLYLQSLPPANMDPEDWSLLVDYLAQRYLPPELALQSGEWMAAKTAVMGKIEAAYPELTYEEATHIAGEIPSSAGPAAVVAQLTPVQIQMLKYGGQRCAENIQALTDNMRHRIKRVILNHQEAEFLGDKAEMAESLQTKLLDEFGTLNRDWRRIAMTEASENSNQGLVSSMPTGSTLRRLEQYKGACAFCRKIDGREFNVVSPANPDKDPENDVWPGKTNIGRSASPMRRVAGTLVARPVEQMWWPAAGVQHPHCRGRWISVRKTNLSGDAEFHAWMKSKLEATRPKRPAQ